MKFNKSLIGVAVLLATVSVKAASDIADSYNTRMVAEASPPDVNAAISDSPVTLPTSPSQIIPSGAPAFDTNGMDFTNVTFKVEAGLETGNVGSMGYIQVDGDFWTLKYCDIGFSGNVALGAFNNGIYSAGADVCLFKNLSNFQLVGMIGVGGNFEVDPGAYGEIAANLNYNLTRATGWGFLGGGTGSFTYVGIGVKVQAANFQFAANGSTFNKMATVCGGYAF